MWGRVARCVALPWCTSRGGMLGGLVGAGLARTVGPELWDLDRGARVVPGLGGVVLLTGQGLVGPYPLAAKLRPNFSVDLPSRGPSRGPCIICPSRCQPFFAHTHTQTHTCTRTHMHTRLLQTQLLALPSWGSKKTGAILATIQHSRAHLTLQQLLQVCALCVCVRVCVRVCVYAHTMHMCLCFCAQDLPCVCVVVSRTL